MISIWAAVASAATEEAETGESPPQGTSEAEEGEGEAAEPEKQPRTVNLLIQGTEPDRWNLDVGGSWNEDAGLYGRLALHTTNLLGRGEVFGATVEVGDRHELYEVEYRRPFLFGRRQSLGVRLFVDADDYDLAGGADFRRQRTGGALTYGRRFGKYHSFALEYRLIDTDESESSVGIGGDAIVRQTTYTSSSLRPRWVYDRLDHPLSPFRGLRLDAALEVAGGALGGDSELVKPTFGLTWFQPLSGRPLRSTLGIRTRLGWLNSTGDQLFSQQRFYLGGQNSIRGFRHRSIAATEDDGTLVLDEQGFPVGGERMAQLNLEVHMLLGDRFRVVLFADTGGVFTEEQGFDLDRLRSSAGTELRLTLPKLNVPLRLIYATNLDPLPEDRFDNFSFSVGVSF